jgi:hypothetical protein
MKPLLPPLRQAPAVLAVAFLGLCLVLTGCGGGQPINTSELSGKITYKGNPLTGGTIHFQSSDMKPPEEGGIEGAAEIQPDGTYTARSLVPGPMVVTIDVPASPPDPSKHMKGPPKDRPLPAGYEKKASYRQIPAKYHNPKTSPLTYEVQNGKQTKDWDLTD